MKILLETAEVKQIREDGGWGIIDGVTNNASHVSKSGRPHPVVYVHYPVRLEGPISLETITRRADELSWHVLEAGLAGADVCTMSMDVLEQLYQHPLTDLGIEMFLNDWKKVPKL